MFSSLLPKLNHTVTAARRNERLFLSLAEHKVSDDVMVAMRGKVGTHFCVCLIRVDAR